MMKRNTTYTRVKNIAEHVYVEAQKRADALPILDNSHRASAANQIGCLGEIIAEIWMKKHNIDFIPELKTTHDYRVSNNITIDVKTKDRTVTPRIDFDNTAPCYNHSHQRPNYFLFVSLQRENNTQSKDIRRFTQAHIVGAISYEELDNIGIRFLKNDVDWRNNTKFWTDCLNVEMWQLITLKETIQLFKKKLHIPSKNSDINKRIVLEMNKRIENGEFPPRKLPDISTYSLGSNYGNEYSN